MDGDSIIASLCMLGMEGMVEGGRREGGIRERGGRTVGWSNGLLLFL